MKETELTEFKFNPKRTVFLAHHERLICCLRNRSKTHYCWGAELWNWVEEHCNFCLRSLIWNPFFHYLSQVFRYLIKVLWEGQSRENLLNWISSHQGRGHRGNLTQVSNVWEAVPRSLFWHRFTERLFQSYVLFVARSLFLWLCSH